MRTMIWKEWRENAKWAVLAMLALALAEYYALFQEKIGNHGLWSTPREVLTKDSFLMVTTFGSAAVALLLALVQFGGERRRDQWAALLHRPVPRSTVFWGKAAAGISLYLAATSLPFLASVRLAAAPGNFAVPFIPATARPGIDDLVAGLAFYFLGAFLALDRGRWFALRIAAGLGAVHLFHAAGDRSFAWALASSLAVAALFAAVAWGAMATNGSFGNRPWLARAALLLVAFYGACGLGTVATSLHGMGRLYGEYGQYAVTEDGQPVLVKRKRDNSIEVADLQNHRLADPRFTGSDAAQHFTEFRSVSWYIGDPHGLDMAWRGFRRSWLYQNEIYDSDTERWFYIPGERRVRGYSLYGCREIGSFGPGGFVASPAVAPPFPQEFSKREGDRAWVGGDGTRLYIIDSDRRTLVPVPVQGPYFGLATQEKPNEQRFTTLAVAQAAGLSLFDLQGRPSGFLSYNPARDVARWGNIQIVRRLDGSRTWILYSASGWVPFRERLTMPAYLDELDARGAVVRTDSIAPEAATPERWKPFDVASAAVSSPASEAWMFVRAALGDRSARGELDWMKERWPYFRVRYLLLLAGTVACAAAARLWAVRQGFPSAAAARWAWFVLAFNLGGLIAFRLAADWPVRAKCPACGKPRRVDDPECPHCGAGWPVPERDGTEIFDGAGAAGR